MMEAGPLHNGFRGRLAHGLGHCGPPMIFGRQRAFRALRDRLGFVLGDGRQDVNREAVGLWVARCRGLANRIGQQDCKTAVPRSRSRATCHFLSYYVEKSPVIRGEKANERRRSEAGRSACNVESQRA
jgi:hypothetical protein